ncbi:MAG: MFS transporter, partial [Microbacterium sp.]
IVLLATSVSLLLIWITNAGKSYDWWSLETILMAGGALVAAIVFVIVELRSREPLVPLSMFRNRTYTLAVIASIATGISMFGTSVFLSQYMQMARGATPTEAGLLTLPMIAGLLIASIVVGQLISRFGHWKPYLIAGGVLLIAGSFLLSTLHYDTNFVLVSLYMFLLGAGVGMTMQNLVLIVQNTANPEEMGVASSGVAFFRSLGGTIGVSIMGAALATSVTNLFASSKAALTAAIMGLGPDGAAVAEQLQSGTLPQVSALPTAVRVIVEDIYAQGIAHSFLIAVPVAVISLIAIIFLPNKPLTRMTTSERIAAGEADLATVSTAEGMAALDATGSVATRTDAAAGEPAEDVASARGR